VVGRRGAGTVDDREIDFSVVLQRGHRREQALARFLRQLDDPAARGYGRYIDAATFGRRFGAPVARVERVSAWLRAHGLRVEPAAPQRTALLVHGTAGQLRTMFGVALSDVRQGTARAWHEPQTQPRIPGALAGDVAGLAGLSDRPSFTLTTEAGAPSDGYDAATLARAYGFVDLWNRGLRGEGQGVAVINFAPYRPKDIAAFDTDHKQVGLPPVTLVKVNGGAEVDADDPTAYEEPALDIETIRGLAPQAAIYEYEAPNGTSYPTMIDRIVADGKARTISLSWGHCEVPGVGTALEHGLLNASLQAATAAGVNVVVASGDAGAFDCWQTDRVPDAAQRKPALDFPSCSTYAISVGGTRLALDGQGRIIEETGWESWMSTAGSGGGIGSVTMPAFQQPFQRADAGGHRQCPDVSAVADGATGYRVVLIDDDTGGPSASAFGGTSGAAPLWAAAIALINQRAARAGIGNLGHLTPLLYRLAATSSPGLADVVRGGNLQYDAGPGYDYATGLGTPRVAALADALATQALR